MLCPRSAEQGITSDHPHYEMWQQGDGPTCMACGSMKADDFMAACEAGTIELGPTDKSYKVYVKGDTVAIKFYFQHLSVEQRKRFVDLMNTKTLKIGAPGYFYSKPFFVAK